MKKTLLVIGVGSAGLLTLSQMCSSLDNNFEIYSVHDPKIPILGVGEATSTNAPYALFKGTDFIMYRDANELDATYKYAVKYSNWRKQSFDSIIFPPAHAVHFDNTRLKDFTFSRLKQRYPTKFKIIEGHVEYFKNINNGVEVKINDTVRTFDWVIDCGGFPKEYSEYTMVDLPLNHALVTRIQEPGNWDYTHHWAHKHGWMFGIPLKSKQGWGYMYNDEITSKEDAIDDMSSILKIDKQSLETREYTFKPYYTTKNLVNGRILKNGNRYMFFEPMEALSMEYYTELNKDYMGLIYGHTTKEKISSKMQDNINSLIYFYRFIYHGGSVYDTEFWKITKKKTKHHLDNDKSFQEMVKFWRQNSTDPNFPTEMKIYPFPAYTWDQFNKNLGYNYLKPAAKLEKGSGGLTFKFNV